MDEPARNLGQDWDDTRGTPAERRGRDGDAGAGDMLGGLGAGAGDRLGPDAEAPFDPANQHRFDDLEPATDTAHNHHPVGEPA